MSVHVCPGIFFFFFFFLDSRLAIFGETNRLLAFCLYCFDCGVVALSAPFFPFGVLERNVLGTCIDF